MYKLIIIDDEALALKQFCNLINWEEYGFSLVESFSDSEKAMEYIQNNRVDLVFTDIRMPKYTGIDIAKACNEKSPAPFVVFISAHSDFEYARQAIHLNICEYLVKPFTYSQIDELLKRAYGLLKKRSGENLFASNLEMLEQQFVFSELVLNNIKSLEELKDKLSSINIPSFYAENPCACIHITINNFENYISNVWKHGRDKLYNAISYLASNKMGLYCSSFAYVKNTFQVLAISMGSDFEFELKNYLTILKSNLKQMLSIDDISIDVRHMDRLSDFVYEQNEKEQNIDDPIIRKSMEYIRNNYKEDFSLEDVAKHISLSRVYFCSYFKKMTGETFVNELNRYRAEKAKELLVSTNSPISAITEDVGYRSIPYFYKIFTRFTGYTPAEYRNQFKEETDE